MTPALARLSDVVAHGLHVLEASVKDEGLDQHDDARVRALHGPDAAARDPPEKSWAILINLAWMSARNACVVLLNLAQLSADAWINDVHRGRCRPRSDSPR